MVAWKGSRINLSAYYENAEASGGFFAQNFEQYGLDFYISHRLSSRLQIGAGYHYGNTNSEIGNTHITDKKGKVAKADSAAAGDFVQNAFNVDLTYVLSPKATLNFGYRYYTTDVKESTDQDFDQNRLILGVNYNF
jgi:outer membrane receptor protein involved in Fe transport